MKYSRSNLKCHELIGLEVSVLEHSDKRLEGLSGVVVWETRNMLFVESSGREIKVPKSYGRFSFKLPSSDSLVIVRGEEILNNPEERVKMCW
ncbi:MAG: ribonuclease P protein subunit [Sulfolobales archaeon]